MLHQAHRGFETLLSEIAKRFKFAWSCISKQLRTITGLNSK